MVPAVLGNYAEYSGKLYWRFGTIYLHHLQGCRIQKHNFLKKNFIYFAAEAWNCSQSIIECLQILKNSDLKHYGFRTEIIHFPVEGKVRFKIRILIFGFRICDTQTRKKHICEEKTNVKCCVQRDSWIKTRQADTETVEPVSSTDWTEDLQVR